MNPVLLPLIFFLGLLTLLPCSLLAAPEPLRISAPPEGQALGKFMEFYLDKGSQLDFPTFRAKSDHFDFKPGKADYPTFGYLPKDAYWVRFVIDNTTGQDMKVIISNRAVALDELTLAHRKADGTWQEVTIGDAIAFDTREIKSRIPAFPFTLQPGLNQFEARFRGYSSMQLPLQVWTPPLFSQFESRENLIMGSIIGCMLSMLLYNFFVAIRFHNTTYYIYIAYIFVFLLHTVIYYGLLGHSFLPNTEHNWLTGHGSFFVIDLASLFAAMFSLLFLRIREFHPKVYWLIILLALGMGANLLLTLAGVADSVRITMGLNFFMSLSLIFGGILQLRNLSYARYYTIAWTSLLGGNLILILANSGWINHSSFSFWSQAAGGSAEIIFLSFALADRFAAINQERIAAVEKQNELQEHLSATQNLLKSEVESKLMLASEVAHRLNNPLNYIQQAIESIKEDVTRIHSITNEIFEDNQGDDPQVKLLKDHLEYLFNDMTPAIKQLELGLSRSTRSVAEIRAISGVDGKQITAITLKELGQIMAERIKENLAGFIQISFDEKPEGEKLGYVNPHLITNLLEKILNDAARASSRPIKVVMNEEQIEGSLAWSILISGDFRSKGQELLKDQERMQHLLHSSHSRLAIELGPSQTFVRLWPSEQIPTATQVVA